MNSGKSAEAAYKQLELAPQRPVFSVSYTTCYIFLKHLYRAFGKTNLNITIIFAARDVLRHPFFRFLNILHLWPCSIVAVIR